MTETDQDTMLEDRSKGNVAPDVIVIGAMRAGTTTLYELMRKTGVVSLPRMKETDFFLEEKFSRGLGWLNGQYSDLSKPIVDVSPNYTKHAVFPGVARRIYETCPNTKLVYILRDPVKRAISEYRHLAAMGHPLPMPEDIKDIRSKSVTDCSLYHDQLQPYLEFWSIKDIVIVEFEDLIADQWGTMKKLFEQLGLPEFTVAEDDIHTNSSDQLQRVPPWWGKIRNHRIVEWIRSKMPREAIGPLKSLFFRGKPTELETVEFTAKAKRNIRKIVADDISALRRLTGRSFSRWDV